MKNYRPVEAMWKSYFVRDRCDILGLNEIAQTGTRALELAFEQGKKRTGKVAKRVK